MSSKAAPRTSEITIKETKLENEGGAMQARDSLYKPLSVKVDEYMLKLGYSNSQALGIVVQILTQGKVRVDFRDFNERLELVNESDRCDLAQAAALFEEHLLSMQSGEELDDEQNPTQRVIVQTPRVATS
ncbi:hypothetical protein EBU02_05755 [bacterium]|jgi:hypothetical protein|nr:hypothetical protein [bacterium]NBS52614.1 hypothetical protein [Spartobacteria bacterium]